MGLSKYFTKPYLRRIPVLGSLFIARWKDHTEALAEIVPGLVLATAPIWLGAILLAMNKGSPSTWGALLYENVNSGEFCLYATATLGPLFYLIFKEYEGQGRFPSGRSFMVIAIIVALISSGLFAAQKAAEKTSHDHKTLDQSFIFDISLFLYVVALLIVYLAHVYKNLFETGAAHLGRQDTNDLVDGLERWSEKQ